MPVYFKYPKTSLETCYLRKIENFKLDREKKLIAELFAENRKLLVWYVPLSTFPFKIAG